MPIVVLCGRKESGKDVFASVAMRHFGFSRFRFAHPLKNMLRSCLADYGYDPDEIEMWIEGPFKETPCPAFGGATPRWAMQTLGTEWRMGLNPPASEPMWAEHLARRISQRYAQNIVVPDYRLPEETDVVRRIHARTVRIIRPGKNGPAAHRSETDIDNLPVEFELLNDGTVDEFRAKVYDFLKEKIL